MGISIQFNPDTGNIAFNPSTGNIHARVIDRSGCDCLNDKITVTISEMSTCCQKVGTDQSFLGTGMDAFLNGAHELTTESGGCSWEKIVDVSESSVAFTCYDDEGCAGGGSEFTPIGCSEKILAIEHSVTWNGATLSYFVSMTFANGPVTVPMYSYISSTCDLDEDCFEGCSDFVFDDRFDTADAGCDASVENGALFEGGTIEVITI